MTTEDVKLIEYVEITRNAIPLKTPFVRPVLNINCNYLHIYAAIYEYEKGVTHTVSVRLNNDFEKYADYLKIAKKVGAAIAKQALDFDITEVVLARRGENAIYSTAEKYLLKAAREGGLKF